MKSIIVFIGAVAAFRPLPGTAPWYRSVADLEENKPEYPINYFVPSFGADEEIKFKPKVFSSMPWVEKNKRPKPHPIDYFVPNFGLDQDILDAQASIAAEEKIHGKWIPVQDENGVW